MDNKEKSLSGRNNKRLECSDPTNEEYTAAWQNTEGKYRKDLVSKPSIEGVIDAKEWVDDGSKL